MDFYHNIWSGMPGDTFEDHQKREQEMIEQAERDAKEWAKNLMEEVEERVRKRKEEEDKD